MSLSATFCLCVAFCLIRKFFTVCSVVEYLSKIAFADRISLMRLARQLVGGGGAQDDNSVGWNHPNHVRIKKLRYYIFEFCVPTPYVLLYLRVSDCLSVHQARVDGYEATSYGGAAQLCE